MAEAAPTTTDIDEAITDLWDVIRAVEMIKRVSGEIAIATDGEVNAEAEGISGTAALVIAHIRNTQILLGGPK